MGKELESDLLVDTQGNCFLCLEKVVLLQVPSPIRSLQCLVRFLKVDLDTMISPQESLMPNQKTSLGRRILKVKLCEECTSLTERFSKLHQQLEKVKFEANHCVKLIHRKLIKAKVTGRTEQFHNLVDSDFEDCGHKKRLQLTKALRIKTMKKCALKLQGVGPKVKVEKMVMPKVKAERLKVESSALYSDSISWTSDNDNRDPDHTPSSDDDNRNQYHDGGEQLSSYSSLNSGKHFHRQNAHSGKGRRHPANNKRVKPAYKCNTCGKVFTSTNNLSTHVMTIHFQLRQHLCDLCEKTFKQKAHLLKHLRCVHSKPRMPLKSSRPMKKHFTSL